MTDTQNSVPINQAAHDQKFKLLTRFLNKFSRNEWFVLLSCATAIVVAVGAAYNSSRTQSTTVNVSDAVKSLEEILEKRFDQSEQDSRAHVSDAIKYLEEKMEKKFKESEQDSKARFNTILSGAIKPFAQTLERNVSDAVKSLKEILEKSFHQSEQDSRAHISDSIKYLEEKMEKKFEQSQRDSKACINTTLSGAIKSIEQTLEKFEKNSQAHISDAIKSLEAHIEAALERKPDKLKNRSFKSCKEVYESHDKGIKEDKAYLLEMDSGTVPVYCHMTDDLGECGGGGWTLVMKIDGNKETFHYDSMLWSNKMSFNLAGGKTGFNTQETKLPTYWNIPFSKICLGMKISERFNFILIKRDADSLYSLIADGVHRATSLGTDKRDKLTGTQAFFGANREGFNSVITKKLSIPFPKARIGVIGPTDLVLESIVGFGIGRLQGSSSTCGKETLPNIENLDPSTFNLLHVFEKLERITAFGYILVQ